MPLTQLGECLPCTQEAAGSSPARYTNTDGYRNGYNGAVLKTEVAKALWVRVLPGAPSYLVRLMQRTRSYGLRNAGWNPARDTIMILSSNWQGYRTFNPGDVGSNPTGITIVPVAQRAEAAGLNPAKCRFDSYQEHQ